MHTNYCGMDSITLTVQTCLTSIAEWLASWRCVEWEVTFGLALCWAVNNV